MAFDRLCWHIFCHNSSLRAQFLSIFGKKALIDQKFSFIDHMQPMFLARNKCYRQMQNHFFVCLLSHLYWGTWVPLACEQQTHFRSSLLSLRREEKRSDDRKCVCCSQANGPPAPFGTKMTDPPLKQGWKLHDPPPTIKTWIFGFS